MLKTRVNKQQYQYAWEIEATQNYPVIDEFEARQGFAIPKGWLQGIARVLACPVKVNPPNWQHGRVIYAAARSLLCGNISQPVRMLDVGTAKGFSALCMQRALIDAGVQGHVTSIDVLDPKAHVQRNTVAEVDGLKSLDEILAPWPMSQEITFKQSTGINWLAVCHHPIDFAFVDGKHRYDVVRQEAAMLVNWQKRGAVVIFDDVQVDGVRKAVEQLADYSVEYIEVLPNRIYAVATRL